MDNREVFYGMFDRIPLISNNTPFEIKIYEGYGGVFRDRSSVPAGGKYLLLKLGLRHSTRKLECRSSLDKFESVVYATASDEDLNEVAEIRFIYQTQDNILTFDVIPRGLSKEDLAIVKPVKDRVASKIGEASRSSIELRKLCNTVKLCRNQCDHLVEACEKGIQKMMQSYSRVAGDPPLIWRFYKAGRLAQLDNSLDRLDSILCDVKDLVEACAEELGWVALVVSMPMPPVTDKKMEACSTFDLLVGELMWHLDCITCIIEHPLQRAGGPGVELEWCPTVHRYVLIRTGESRNDVIAGTESAVPKPDTNEDVESRAHADREELQSGLDRGWIILCRHLSLSLHFFRPHRKMLSDIIIKRCKVNMHFDQHPSMDIRSLSVDPECLRISHRDVKLKPSGIVGSGSFKVILEGEWCGQSVVIAMLSKVRRDGFEKEVMHASGKAATSEGCQVFWMGLYYL